jgi:hypothetical protein
MEPATPLMLLDASDNMRCGAQESPQEAFRRGLAAIKQLVSFGVNTPGGFKQGQQSPRPGQQGFNNNQSPISPRQGEDPMVSSVLGSGNRSPRSHNNNQSMHYGFTCDASGVCPIVGDRFKSTNTFNHDISSQARLAGTLAGACGYRPIRDRVEAMRWALGAVMSWWWLLWPGRGDLFNMGFPDLRSLPEQALLQAITNLPEPDAASSSSYPFSPAQQGKPGSPFSPAASPGKGPQGPQTSAAAGAASCTVS